MSIDEASFATALTEARQRWPDVTLSEPAFRAHLEALGVDDERLRARAADLYLAAACATGQREAIRALEALLDRQALPFLLRFGGGPTFKEELRQRILMKLLAGPKPGVATYAGAAPLVAWLRVAGTRAALDLRDADARAPRPVADDDQIFGQAFTQSDPELEIARRRHGPTFQEALEASLTSLGARERRLLRLHFVERSTIDDLAVIYSVHRATVARWLVDARKQVLAEMCKRLELEIGTSASQVRSLIFAVRDDLHVSLCRLLGEDAGRDPDGNPRTD